MATSAPFPNDNMPQPGAADVLPFARPRDDDAGDLATVARPWRNEWPAAVTLALLAHIVAFTVMLSTGQFKVTVADIDTPPPPLALTQATEIEESELEPGAAARGADNNDPAPASSGDPVETEEVEMVEYTLPPVDKSTTGTNAPRQPTPQPADVWKKLKKSSADSGGSGAGTGKGAAGRATYGLRSNALRGRGLEERGGTAATEKAVRDGLAWLASVQDLAPADPKRYGRWDPSGYMRGYLPRQKDESNIAYDERCRKEGSGSQYYEVGMTALVTLAFTGAGYTREEGSFAVNVAAALDYLLRCQDADGCFMSPERTSAGDMYDHSIALLAVCDYLAMTGDEEFRGPAVKGVEFMLRRQQPHGGWDYKSYAPEEEPARSDLSITGFCLMALNAARAAGLVVPPVTMARLQAFINESCDREGHGIYANAGMGMRRSSAGMTAVNLMSRRLLGQPFDVQMQRKQVKLLLRELPDWHRAHSMGSDPYQWYYSSLALIMEGGKDWETFNVPMKRALVTSQEQTPGPRKGSWPATTYIAREYAGRVYATAIAVLCLEVYYRYVPEFLAVSGKEYEHLWPAEAKKAE